MSGLNDISRSLFSHGGAPCIDGSSVPSIIYHAPQVTAGSRDVLDRVGPDLVGFRSDVDCDLL